MWRERLQHLLAWRKSRAFRWGFSIALLLAFAGLVLYRFAGDWRQLVRTQVAINAGFVGAAIGLCGFNFLLFLLAWQGIVTTLGGSSGWHGNAQVYSVTYLTRFLPTSVWFFAGRIHFGDQIGLQTRHALYATGLELGLHIGTALCFYLALEFARLTRWWAIVILVPVLIVVWRMGWLRLLKLPGDVRIRRRDMAWWGILYLVTWVTAGPYLQTVVRAFVPSTISMWDAWRIWTLASLAGYAGFLLLGGMGFLRELSMSALLSRYLLPGDALIVAIGARLVLLVSSILWATLVILVTRAWSAVERKKRRTRAVDDE